MCQWLEKKLRMPVAGFLYSSRWTDYTMLLDGIIVMHLSEWIEFNFDLALNTIEFSIRVTFYFFVCMVNESKGEWRTLKIIDTSFLHLIAPLCYIIIFRFILLRESCWQKRFNYFVNRITENKNKELWELCHCLFYYQLIIKLTEFLVAFSFFWTS